jgi:nucleotide-binding universal stress UspA family protein
MNKVTKILAPTDLSELSCVGVRSALEFAESQGAEVILYYVVGIADDWLSARDEFDPVRRLVEDQKCLLDKL